MSLFFWLSRIATTRRWTTRWAKATTGRALASFENLTAALGEAPPDPGELFDLRGDVLRAQNAVRAVLERMNDRYRRAIELRFVTSSPEKPAPMR